jgi:hypothetical protein
MIPRPRLTVRRLMIVAMILCVLLMGEKMRRVSRYRSMRAAELADEAESWSKDASVVEKMMANPGGNDEADTRVRLTEIRDAARGYRKRSEYCRGLASVYEHAAYRPWLWMEPEPPLPE